MSNYNSPTIPPKLPKGKLKCFHCRELFILKDGKWQNWEQMQVFLCKTCDNSTLKAPERHK